MVRYKIIFNKDDCIGALACFGMAPDYWEEDPPAKKVDLKGAKYNKATNRYELIINEDKYIELQGSADVCPVKVIEVVKIDDQGNEIREES